MHLCLVYFMCVAVFVVDVFSLSLSEVNNAEEKQKKTLIPEKKDLIPEDEGQSPELSEEFLALSKGMIEDSSNATVGCMSDKTRCLAGQSLGILEDCLHSTSCCHCCSKRSNGHPVISYQEHDLSKSYCGHYMNGGKCWGDGRRCMGGSTCGYCCRGESQHWWTRGMTACGHEPCWGRGTRCVGGSSCGRCCSGSEWKWNKFGHFCK